jgi:hypothetical protein
MNGVDASVNNPITFLSEYPSEITAAAVSVTVNQQLSGNISYAYSIT